MNQLRQLMLEELHRRNFADAAIRTYVHGACIRVQLALTRKRLFENIGTSVDWNQSRYVGMIAGSIDSRRRDLRTSLLRSGCESDTSSPTGY